MWEGGRVLAGLGHNGFYINEPERDLCSFLASGGTHTW